MSNTNNYDDIEYTKFTLKDIDDSEPIRVGNTYTVRNVFNGLNKIIKAIKTRLTSDNERLSALEAVVSDTKRIIAPASGQKWSFSNGYINSLGTVQIPLQGKRNCWFDFKWKYYHGNLNTSVYYTDESRGQFYWCPGTNDKYIEWNTSSTRMSAADCSCEIGHYYSGGTAGSTTGDLYVRISNMRYNSENDSLQFDCSLSGTVNVKDNGSTIAPIPRDEIYFDIDYTLY